jgi:hypothetical protein
MFMVGQTKQENPSWIGKSNRILNPGAESNNDGAPLNWKSDFSLGAESNWVSEYGVTSHEWNHGAKKLGLPNNPGNNYFRLTVNKNEETRKLNIFQSISLGDAQIALQKDTVMADFQFWSGITYPNKTNCALAEVKVFFKDVGGKTLDSIYVKRVPSEFRDLDEGTPEAEERGFNVMHEMVLTKKTHQVPRETQTALLHIQCEFPCAKFIDEEEDETEGELSNTFFFDNLSLGFYKK